MPFLEHWGMVWIEYRTQPGTCGCPSDLNEDGFVGFRMCLRSASGARA